MYERIHGASCEITLEPRPSYCDRGRWLAKVFPTPGGPLALEFDGQDGWPRYYFVLANAKQEVEAWLQVRGEWTPASAWEEITR